MIRRRSRPAFQTRSALAALLCAGALAMQGAAQTAAPTQTMSPTATRAMALIEGTGELLQFDRDIEKVAIAEPKIADAVVISARDVMVNAKGPGQTTLVVWESGNVPVRYNIRVAKDTQRRRPACTPGSTASAQSGAARIEQSNSTAKANPLFLPAAWRAPSFPSAPKPSPASTSKKVVNMLQTGDPRQILLEVKFADVDRTALSQFGFNLLSRNPAMVGATSTQQFPEPLFTQLGAGECVTRNTSLNLTNLLNLFPDLSARISTLALLSRRCGKQNVAQILAEPNLIVVEGSEGSFLAGGEFPVSHRHIHAHHRFHRARGHGAVQEVWRTVEFHADRHCVRRH